MYHTKLFKNVFLGDNRGPDEISNWLSNLSNPFVVGYVTNGSNVLITVLERPVNPLYAHLTPARATIDPIPEDPTINRD